MPTLPRRVSARSSPRSSSRRASTMRRSSRFDGAAPKAVEASDKQICVEGLEHGRHYNITFRAGLPAAIGEVLEAPVALSIYIQDRAPSARFTGDSFVLPATARHGIPVVTVNMDVADMKLFRIGDRSLAQLLSGYQFLRQLDGYDIDTIADQMGAPVWEGKLDIANELNKEVTTSFPIDEALPDRKPGVYVLTAQPENDTSDDWNSRATQWFVVSDIGLSTYTGQDGLNVFARSLVQRQAAGRCRTDAAGPQQRDSRHRQDRRRGPRHLHAGPDARRRRHGAGRDDGQCQAARISSSST